MAGRPTGDTSRVEELLADRGVVLPIRVRRLLELRYRDRLTLAQVGEALLVSTERVRQVEWMVLRSIEKNESFHWPKTQYNLWWHSDERMG